jgi:hypothetical protein
MKKILLTAFFGYLAVLMMGMLFYRFRIFNPQVHYFQIVELGFIGAVLYPVSLYKEKKDIYLTFVILLTSHFIFFRPPRTGFIIRDIIVLASILITIMIYVNSLLPLIRKRFKILQVFTLAFTYALINAAAFILLMIILYLFFDRDWGGFGESILLYIRYGFIIGFGLGIGFNFAEFIIDKSEASEEEAG